MQANNEESRIQRLERTVVRKEKQLKLLASVSTHDVT